MKLFTKRMVIAASAVALIGGGGAIVNTSPAHADPPAPGNLTMFGSVNCYWKGWGPTWDNLPGWRMHREMGVVNTGGVKMTGVTISEIGGANVLIPPNKTRKTKAGELAPGQAYRLVNTTWNACFPSSVSGYTIGREVENPVDNFGFWVNVQQQPGPGETVPETAPPAGS